MQALNVSRKTVVHALALAALGAAAVVSLEPLGAQEVSRPAAAATSPSEIPDPPKPATQPNGGDRVPGGLMDRAADSGAQVYVDDSFASVEKLRVALRYASQNRSQEAINAFHEIVEKYGQKLVYLNNDSYVSITDYVREKLLAMPDVRQGMYDQIFGAQAEKEIAAASDAHDLSGLIRICDRYYCAAAAQKGLLLAADWYFERAEFSSAARTWQLLLNHPKSRGMQANLLFRAAAAEKLSGNEAGAKKLRERLAKDFPDAMGTVDGQSTNLLAATDGILKGAAWERAVLAADEWPTFGGNASRSGLLDVNSSAGARLWGVDLANEASRGTANRNPMIQVQMGRRIFRGDGSGNVDVSKPPLSSHPVVSSGTLYVHTGERLMALSSNAGTLLWTYPAQPISRLDAAQQQMLIDNVYNQAFRSVSHDAAAVYGDQVFAVLPAPTAPPQVRSGPVYYAQMPMGNTRVVALNRNGVQLWERAAHTVKTDAKGQLTFVGSPLVTRQGVFVMGSKQGDGAFTQMYLVRLDRETGEVTWSCYLCSASTGGYYGYNMMAQSNIAIPTLADEVVYISTGQGADCAVDANAGRILWLQITESAKKMRNPNDQQMFQGNMANIEGNAPSWKFDPPQVYGDKLITHETGGNVRVYDRWNGRLIRSIARKDLENVEVMAGVLDHNLILVGSKIVGLNLDKIEQSVSISWTVDAPSSSGPGRLQGRPFLASAVLYVPYEKGLQMVDPRLGRQIDFSYWPKNEKDEDGKAGNILVTSEQIIVVNESEIAGYARWEVARDNRLARIRENPANPEPYLALGEIAFRTNHIDLAEENMKKAVALATSPEAPAAGGDLLSRLYHTNLNFAEQLLGKADEALRDRARFYYEQCKLAARDVEQQAEWRLCMAQLSLAQKKPDEAAALYSEVLADTALRTAPYRRGDMLALAGVTAEMNFHTLVEKYSPAVYKRYEDQAVALLARSRASKDAAGLEQVVAAYPNSSAALDAATELAAAYRDRGDLVDQIKTLRWLYTRITGERKGRATADLAVAYFGIKKFAGAADWTQRGLRQYKDLSWTEPATGRLLTFSALNDRLRAAGATLAEGRLPVLPPPVPDANGHPGAPAMDNESSFPKQGILGTLMAPIEQAGAYRRPDKLFVGRKAAIHIFDSATMSELTSENPVKLPDDVPSTMLGHYGDIAVIVQAKAVLGLNVKTQSIAWTVPFRVAAEDLARQFEQQQRIRALAVAQAAGQVVNANMLFMENPEAYAANPSYQNFIATLDADQARAFAFSMLNRPGQREVAFSTMRMINNKLVVVVNGELVAYDVATGKPAWKDRAGNAMTVKLPEGYAASIVGNEDLIVVQVDGGERATPTFYVVDADTGKFRRQIKLDDERAQWRTLSEDGTLFVMTDQAVCAYDLFSDQERPLWRRVDLPSRYPAATALTLDGLILVSGSSDLVCLSLEGGEVRWPRPNAAPIHLTLPVAQGQSPFLRAVVDGDTVIYQSSVGIEAYYSYSHSTDDDKVAWKGMFTAGEAPPLASFQLSDPYAVVLASGPLGSTPRAVSLLFIDRKGGKRDLKCDLTHTLYDNGGPVIRNWQLLDNGVAMEISGQTYFYRGKK